jgi:branched-chain amino acid aminotransferase
MFWLNGEIFDGPRAPFDLTDRGLLLGDGVFDTALVLGGRIFCGEAHLKRLFEAMAALGIRADHGQIHQAAEALSARGKDGVLRLTVTRGPGPRGLRPQEPQHPTILATFAPLSPNLFFAPLSLHLSAIRRNETSPTSRLKTLNYLDAILAARDAAEKGHDEALLLNCAGRVACAAAGNVFAVFGQEIVTPPLSEGVLPGIIRSVILAECGAREAALDFTEVMTADALFVTNSVRLISPVTRLGDRALRSSESRVIGDLQHHIRQALLAECTADLPFPQAPAAHKSG